MQIDRKQIGMSTTTATEQYSLRRVKTFRGMDGQGLNAKLVKSGKVMAFILDEGRGGEMRFDWMDLTKEKSAEEDLWNAFIAEEKAKLDDTKKDECGFTERSIFDGATWVNKKVDDLLNDKRFRRICKTHVVYQVGADVRTAQFYKIKGGTDVIAHLRQKYAAQKLRILNEEFKG